MKVAIYSRGLEDGQEQHLAMMLQELQARRVSVQLYSSLASASWSSILNPYNYSVFNSGTELTASIDCLISLGGDGTMLDCATLIRNKNIPLLGINFGRLGFLAVGRELSRGPGRRLRLPLLLRRLRLLAGLGRSWLC